MKPWQRSNPTTSHKIGWRTIVTKTFVMPSGETTTFDTFGPEKQHHAAVIGITSNHEAIVARQFRVGPEQIMDELPGGTVNEGEDFAVAAEREFKEETGYQPKSIEYLGSHHKDAYMNATWHFFLATNCKRVTTQKLDAEEHIEICLLPINQLIDNAKHDRMTDAVAVLMAYDRLIELFHSSSKAALITS